MIESLRMAKRGRPKTVSEDVHLKRYYKPNTRRDNEVIFKAMEERLLNAYQELHMLAFDEPIGWFEVNPIKRKISDILSQ
jgi:hypothetical protein